MDVSDRSEGHHGLLVLLIDDDDALRESVSAGLATYGYRVTALASGASAVQAVSADPPSAIVLDLFMPEMDGFEVMRGLRDLPACPPVIAISGGGRSQSDLLPLALGLGAAAVLHKPFSIEVLDATIRQVIPHCGDAPPSPRG
jgi:two-component system KDP operon response regulator KdpE